MDELKAALEKNPNDTRTFQTHLEPILSGGTREDLEEFLTAVFEAVESDDSLSNLMRAADFKAKSIGGELQPYLTYRIGKFFLDRVGNEDMAEMYFRRLPPESEFMVELHDFYVDFYLRKENWRKLEQLFLGQAEAQGHGDAESEAKRLTARLAKKRGNPDRAMAYWQALRRTLPGDLEVQDELLDLYRATEKWHQVADVLKAKADALPSDEIDQKVSLYEELIPLYQDKLRMEPKVAATYQEILNLQPDNQPAFDSLCQHYESTNRWPDLVKMLKSRIDTTDDDSVKLQLLREVASIMEERFNNVTEAMRCYESMHELAPDDLKVLRKLKELYEARRDWKNFVPLAQKELQFMEGEERSSALRALAQMALVNVRETAVGAKLWKQVKAEDPEDPEAFDALMQLYERGKDFEGVAELLEERIEQVDRDEQKSLLERLAIIYGSRIQDVDLAADSWKRLLGLDGENHRAKAELKKILVRSKDLEAIDWFFREFGTDNDYSRTLETMAKTEEDPVLKVLILFSLADLQLERGDQADKARTALEQVLEEDPHNVRAAEKLVGVYEDLGRWAELVHVQELLLNEKDDLHSEERLELFLAKARIHEERLRELEQAFFTYVAAYQLDYTRQDVDRELERLAGESGNWETFISVVEGTLELRAVETEKIGDLLRIAGIFETRLEDSDSAVAYYKRALAIEEHNRVALAALQRLYEKGGQWEELKSIVELRLETEGDQAQRRQLLLDMGQISLDYLGDPDGAVEAYTTLISEFSGMPAAYDRLAQVLVTEKRHEELLDVLEQRLAALQPFGDALSDLMVDIGMLYYGVHGNVVTACDRYVEALRVIPDHPRAISLLEEFIGNEEVQHRVAVALEPVYARREDSQRLADTLEIQLAWVDDVDRTNLLGRLKTLYLEAQNMKAASLTVQRLLRLVPEDAALKEELEDLAGALDDWFPVVSLYAEIMGSIADEQHRHEVMRSAARIYAHRIEDKELSKELYRSVLEEVPDDQESLFALQDIAIEEEDWLGLLEIYETRKEFEHNPEARIAIMRDVADLCKGQLGDLEKASSTVEEILDLDPSNLETLRLLDELYTLQERWQDLMGALEQMRGLAQSTEVEAGTLLRMAELCEQKLEDPEGMVDKLEQVLGLAPEDERAIEILERNIDGDIALPVLDLLEAYMRRTGQFNRLIDLLALRKSFIEESHVQVDIQKEIARIYEEELGRVEEAFETYRIALGMAPEDEDTLTHLIILAENQGNFEQLFLVLDEETAQMDECTQQVEMWRIMATISRDKLGEQRTAIDYFKRVVDREPEDLDAVTSLAALYRDGGQWEELVVVLETQAQLLSDTQEKKQLLLEMGAIYYDSLELPGDAIRAYEEILELDYEDATALERLEDLYQRTERWEELEQVLQRRALLLPSLEARRELLLRRADVLDYSLERYDDAFQVLNELFIQDNMDMVVVENIEALHEKREDWFSLLDILRHKLDLTEEDTHVGILLKMAQVHVDRLEDVHQGVAVFARILEQFPHERGVLDELERIVLSMDEKEEAYALLKPQFERADEWERLLVCMEALRESLEDVLVKVDITLEMAAIAEERVVDFQRAFYLAAQALSLTPNRVDIADMLEQIGHKADMLEQVVEAYSATAESAEHEDDMFNIVLRKAELLKNDVQDFERAVKEYETLRELRPEKRILEALDELYTVQENWDDLVAILRDEAESVHAPDGKLVYLYRLADLQEHQLGDSQAACEVIKEAYLLDAENSDTLSLLRRLFEEALVDDEAADMLETHYTSHEMWDDVAAVLQRRFTLAQETSQRLELCQKLMGTYLDKLGDKAMGHHFCGESLILAPEEEHTLFTLLQLMEETGRFEETVGFIQSARADVDDVETFRRLSMEAGKLLVRLENHGDAEAAFKEAIDKDEDFQPAWQALEALHEGQFRHDEHEATLEKLVSLVEYEDERIPLLLKLGRLRRDMLDSPSTATEAFASALKIDDRNEEALASLAYLYEVQEMWDRLTEVLTNTVELTQDEDERLALLARLAGLYEERLEDVEQAISCWVDILDWKPMDENVLANLQRLYEQMEQWQDFVEMAERQVRLENIPQERKIQLARQIARAASLHLEDATLSQQYWEMVASSAPGDDEALEQLRSLYRRNEDYMKLAALLENMASIEEVQTADRIALWTELGQIRMDEIMDLDGAVAAWNQVRALDPSSFEPYDALERLYQETARFEECVALLLEKLALIDDDNRKVELLGTVATIQEESMNNWRDAAQSRQQILVLDPHSMEQYSRIAEMYEMNEEWESLAELLTRRLEVEEDELEITNTLKRVAEIYEENLQRDDAALDALKKALLMDPGNVELLDSAERLAERSELWQDLYEIWAGAIPTAEDERRLGLMLRLGALLRDKLENYAEAISWFEKVLELDDEHEQALTALVTLYELDESWEKLAGTLEQLAVVTPDFRKQVEYSLQLGDVLHHRIQDVDRAQGAYRQVLELDPTDEKAVEALQALYSEAEKWEDLIEVLAMRASLHPEEDSQLKLISGEIYEGQLSEPLKAAEIYEELVAYDPTQSEAFDRLERIYTDGEVWDRLAETYEKRLSVAMDDSARVEMLKKLALLNESVIDDQESAADYYQQILDYAPEDGDIIASLERLYEQQERYDDLVLVLRRSVQLAESVRDKVEYLEKVALIYSDKLSDLGSAIMNYKEILELDPAHTQTLTRLETLFSEEGDWMEVQNILDQRIQMARDVDEVVAYYLKKGDIYKDELLMPDRAREQYHMALERDPEFAQATTRLIDVYSEEENWDKIVDILLTQAKAVSSEEKRANLFAQMGNIMKDRMSNLDGAVEVFEAALERVPELPEALTPLAEIYMGKGQWEKAFPLLEMSRHRLESEDSDSAALADLYRRMATASSNIGQRDDALDYYRKAYDRNPDDLATLEGLARLNLEQENFEVAEAYFRSLIERGEDAFETSHLVSIYRAMGEIDMHMGRPDSAQDHLARVLELQPDAVGVLEDLAQLMEYHDDWDGAIRYRRQLVGLLTDPLEQWKVLIAIGDTYREKLDDMPRAIKAYNEALEVQPYSKNALVKLLEIHINAKAYEEAINVLQHLIQVEENPQRKASYTFTIATIYRQELNEPEMSVDFYEETLELNPDKLEAFRAVDEILTSLKDWETLEEAYRKMIARTRGKDLEKVEFMLYKGLGEIYRSRLKKYDMAASSFELAANLKPADDSVREILAQLYELLDQKEKAIAQHRALVALDPQRVDSYRKMTSLFREMGLVDDAWFATSVLAMAGKLETEEKGFYQQHRPAGLLHASRSLDAPTWLRTIFSKAESYRVGETFQTLYQAIGSYLDAKDPKDLGLRKKDEVDLKQKTVFSTVFNTVCQLLGIPAPRVYLSDRSFGMRIEATIPPVLIIGKDMLHGKSEKELAFTIAKNLAYFHPMHILAACYPAPVLKLFYKVAVKFVEPNATVDGSDTEQFRALAAQLQKRISPALANALSGSVGHYIKKGRSPSVSKWLTGVELTANHAGLLACMDLSEATRALKQESIAFSKLPPKEKAKELVLYAVSEEFGEARTALGLELPR